MDERICAPVSDLCPGRNREGFSLVELLICIGVIAALAGISYAAFGPTKAAAQIKRTTQLVQAVAAQIAASGAQTTTVQLGGRDRVVHLWNVDRQDESGAVVDLEIDGDPQLGWIPAVAGMAVPATYRGLANGVEVAWPKGSVAANGQLIDAWGEPLRVDFNQAHFAPSRVGIWSKGPDRESDRTQPETLQDDIVSWNQEAP